MKKIVMLTMLLVSASTFMMAQTPIEQAREKAKTLIKGGVTDISKILPKHESDDDEDVDDDDDDSTIDPLEGKSEEYIRGFNDARRKTYEEQKASFAKAGIDFNQTALSKLRMDSVGIYANIDNSLVAMKHIDFKEIERTGYINPFKDKELITFEGKTSPYAFAGGKATFRIYFTHDRNSISEFYDMFSSDYSIDDFFVVKFKSVGKGRQMTSAVVHSNRIEGAKEDKSVKLEVKKVSDNVYDLTVEGQPGEYCLTYNNKQGNTSNGMKNSGSKKVFDFTIK